MWADARHCGLPAATKSLQLRLLGPMCLFVAQIQRLGAFLGAHQFPNACGMRGLSLVLHIAVHAGTVAHTRFFQPGAARLRTVSV